MALLTNKWTEMAPTLSLVNALSTEGFGKTIFSVLDSISPITILFVIEIRDYNSPRFVIWEGNDYRLADQNRQVTLDYVTQLYRKFLQLPIEGPLNHPADFPEKKSEPRETALESYFFNDCGKEFSGFSKEDDHTLYLGLFSKNESFPPREQNEIIYLAPMFLSIIRKHCDLIETRQRNVVSLPSYSQQSLVDSLLFNNASLSYREAEVCAAIVLGHSANAIGDLLEISPLTVATHRKRAYSKLKITSQTQLFGKLFANNDG